MAATDPRAARTRAPKGAVVKNPTRDGFSYALRFTVAGKRQYVTLGKPEDGWNDQRAELELRRVLDQVRDGTWTPWQPPEEPEPEATFHEFASQWFEANREGWREATRLDYEWQLVVHLLPFFKDHELSQITVAEVDRYRESKLAENRAINAAAASGRPRMRTYTDKLGHEHRRPERPLSATSINKTITRLGQILEVAVERDLLTRNPVKINPRNRRVKARKPDRTYIDRPEHLQALLDAAGYLDRHARSNGQIPRRALLATLALAGLRISEALELRWRDVDLPGGRLRVRQSKTDAGVRYVDLLPALHDELTGLKARTDGVAAALVFPSAAGTRQDRNRVRNRVLAPAIARADEQLQADGLAPLPEGLTLHALRRTFVSLRFAIGDDLPYISGQTGHETASITFVYAKPVRPEDRDRWRKLVGRDETAGEQAAAAAPAARTV